MKKDYITAELIKGSFISVAIASFSVAFLNIAIRLFSGSIDDMKAIGAIIALIPSVNLGVTAIYFLVAGCLSLQYMRFLMLFGATRTSAFLRYTARVVVALIPTLLLMLLVSLISRAISGMNIIPYSEYVITFITSSLCCFAAGCFFSSITTLFRPFISFVVIAAICISTLTLSGYVEALVGHATASGYFSLPEPLLMLIIAIVLLAISSLIHHIRISDMKTTSIS